MRPLVDERGRVPRPRGGRPPRAAPGAGPPRWSRRARPRRPAGSTSTHPGAATSSGAGGRGRRSARRARRRAAPARASRAAPGTSAAARRREPPHSRGRSRGARRARCRTAPAAGRRASDALAEEAHRARPLCRRSSCDRVRLEPPGDHRFEPARIEIACGGVSPEPGVVRDAAFVHPEPGSSRSPNCSNGSKTRGVKPASWRRRQKSFRGFAKWACAAAETRPGLMPQKTQLRFGARTSGTSEAGAATGPTAWHTRGPGRGANPGTRKRRTRTTLDRRCGAAARRPAGADGSHAASRAPEPSEAAAPSDDSDASAPRRVRSSPESEPEDADVSSRRPPQQRA